MILIWLIAVLMAGGVAAWLSEKWNSSWPRIIALLAMLIDFAYITIIWIADKGQTGIAEQSQWIIEIQKAWIPTWGISLHLAIDGLSLLLLQLTFFLGALSVLVSWKEMTERVGFYYFNLLWTIAGIAGVFMALDLFLFYFFWEVMLIPMYFLIGIWGSENRTYAAYKFFIFTQAGGLLMLLSILTLYFVHGANTGTYSYDYTELLHTSLSPALAFWLMMGFLIAFIIKLPVIPFHTWLPDAHTEAPTAGSLILAGLLLKTGAYGIIRFVLPLFPETSAEIADWAMILGIAGIIYGAILAFAQTDFKRLVAYTSVSHMGFVMLGVFAFNELAMQGVVMQLITHGISTGALFILAGVLKDRLHTRDINQMGGLWSITPQMGAVGLLFAMASLGLPGLGNFIAEFLTLVGSYQANQTLTIIAASGLVASAIYSLRIVQRVFLGKPLKQWNIHDLSVREWVILGSLAASIVWLGVNPQPVLNTAKPSVNKVLEENFLKVDTIANLEKTTDIIPIHGEE